MSTFNVLRYSALGAGILYGAIHRQSLESCHQEETARKEWVAREKLINQAKQEFAKTKAVAAPAVSSTGVNWEDPNLDIGAALEGLIQKLD